MMCRERRAFLAKVYISANTQKSSRLCPSHRRNSPRLGESTSGVDVLFKQGWELYEWLKYRMWLRRCLGSVRKHCLTLLLRPSKDRSHNPMAFPSKYQGRHQIKCYRFKLFPDHLFHLYCENCTASVAASSTPDFLDIKKRQSEFQDAEYRHHSGYLTDSTQSVKRGKGPSSLFEHEHSQQVTSCGPIQSFLQRSRIRCITLSC